MNQSVLYRRELEDTYSFTGTESFELLAALSWVEEVMPWALNYDKPAIRETRQAIQHCIDSGAEFLGRGTTRICFEDGPYRVVKIAYTISGISASEREIEHYENFCGLPEEYFDPEVDYFPTAECRYLNLDFSHIRLLTMERIFKFPAVDAEVPLWTNFIDCRQVGYNSYGELVAYDL